MVKQHHPDTSSIDHIEAAKKLESLKKAYSVLSSPTLRQEYDLQNKAGYQDVPFYSMKAAMNESKQKEEEPSTLSYHERLKDKTYQFNYYATTHKTGKMQENSIRYDNPNNIFDQAKYHNASNTNIYADYQSPLNKVGIYLICCVTVGYVIYDLVDLHQSPSSTIDKEFDDTDRAFFSWMNNLNQREAK